MSDARLNEVTDQTRGCGGVAILWKKELLVHNIICPGNGRLCCIKIQLSDCSYLTIIGVYMPSNGYTDEYKSCLSDLEELVSTVPHSQPIMLVGDTTSGPNYTFCSGGVRTIVDYIIVKYISAMHCTATCIYTLEVIQSSKFKVHINFI